jgi:hypothetical protein
MWEPFDSIFLIELKEPAQFFQKHIFGFVRIGQDRSWFLSFLILVDS